MTPSITEEQLHKLEAELYARAMDGDSRLGLYLLRLYFKDLKMVETQEDTTPYGVVFLPKVDNEV